MSVRHPSGHVTQQQFDEAVDSLAEVLDRMANALERLADAEERRGARG